MPVATSPKIPPPPDRLTTASKLLDYWRTLIPEFEPRVMGYLYRTWPIINREPRYIEKLAKPYETEREILRQWGTGKYKLVLTDNSRRAAQLCEALIEFGENYADHPPVVEVTELDMGRKENKAYIEWLRSQGKLKMPDGPAPAPAQSDTAVTALASTLQTLLGDLRSRRNDNGGAEASFAKIMEMFTTANRTALDMALSQVKRDSPTETVELLTKLQNLFGAPKGSGDDAMMKFLLQELTDARRESREMMRLIMERQSPAKSGLAEFREMAEAMSSMRELFGGGGNDGGIVRDLLQHGPTILAEAKQIIFGVGAMAARQPAPTAMGTAPAPPATENPAVAQDPMAQLSMFEKIALQAIGGPLINYVSQGMDGRQFADWLVDGHGTAAFQQVVDMGQEGILKILKSAPEVWAQLGPIEVNLNKFIAQFLSWTPEWNAEEIPPPPPRS